VLIRFRPPQLTVQCIPLLTYHNQPRKFATRLVLFIVI